jgi:hypothetical protein
VGVGVNVAVERGGVGVSVSWGTSLTTEADTGKGVGVIAEISDEGVKEAATPTPASTI